MKRIWCDGKSEFLVSEDEIVLWSEPLQSCVVLSRTAFQQIVTGWERLLDQEGKEGK